jgi:acyl-CoA reductase-like NAD-dependent aldehyde dehydrogenase
MRPHHSPYSPARRHRAKLAEVVKTEGVSHATREDARTAVEAAARAFPAWSATPPAERGRLLGRASELLMDRQSDIAALVTAETGGTLGWGMFNVELAAGMLSYYAGQANAPTEEQEIPSHIPGKRAKAIRQPVGVVVGIAPWNAPVVLGVRAVAAPLAYGNTVVLKASEQCPRTHRVIVEALRDAGVPADAIKFVANDPKDAADVVDELIANPAVRRINFTGSTRVGRIIAEKAARHLKPVLLELGGKAPLVVLGDADLERAVAAANFGSFMHQGQICMSTERIVVDRSVAKEFAEKLGEQARSLKMGDPRDPDTQIGPVANEEVLKRVTEHVEDAVSRGARLIAGGKEGRSSRRR